MRILWKIVFATALVVALFYLSFRILSGNGQYEWFIKDESVGILRTDTNGYVILAGLEAHCDPGTNLLQTDPGTGVTVVFRDQTMRPGRVTLKYRSTIIDVMERAVLVDNVTLPWQPPDNQSKRALPSPE